MAPPEAPAWLLALEQSPLGLAMRESLWLYPAVETLHILGFSALVGAIAVTDLRLMGLGHRIDLRAMLRAALPVAWLGFALAVPTGALLFLTEATAYVANDVFPVKIGLIAVAALNGLAFHTLTAPRLAARHHLGIPPLRVRAHGAASIMLWIVVLVCGRLIAYL
jgi:hypothetical protein